MQAYLQEIGTRDSSYGIPSTSFHFIEEIAPVDGHGSAALCKGYAAVACP